MVDGKINKIILHVCTTTEVVIDELYLLLEIIDVPIRNLINNATKCDLHNKDTIHRPTTTKTLYYPTLAVNFSYLMI